METITKKGFLADSGAKTVELAKKALQDKVDALNKLVAFLELNDDLYYGDAWVRSSIDSMIFTGNFTVYSKKIKLKYSVSKENKAILDAYGLEYQE